MQQLVAAGVAEAVVDDLEVVEVQEQQRRRVAAAPGARLGALEAVVEQRAVREAGQRVVQRLVGERLLGREDRGLVALALADVVHDRRDGDGPARRVEDGGQAHGHRHDVTVAGRQLGLEGVDGAVAAEQFADVLAERRGDEVRGRPADGVGGGEAGQLLGARVPADDRALGVEGDDRVAGGLDDRGEPAGVLARVLVEAPGQDVGGAGGGDEPRVDPRPGPVAQARARVHEDAVAAHRAAQAVVQQHEADGQQERVQSS